jgi:hypothetical protein
VLATTPAIVPAAAQLLLQWLLLMLPLLRLLLPLLCLLLLL